MAAMRAGPGTDAYERTSEWPRNAVSGRPQSAFFRRRSVLGRRESATFPDSRRPAPRGPFEPGGKRRVANPEKPKNDGSPSIFQKQWIGSRIFQPEGNPKPRKGLWLFFLSDDSSGKKIFFNPRATPHANDDRAETALISGDLLGALFVLGAFTLRKRRSATYTTLIGALLFPRIITPTSTPPPLLHLLAPTTATAPSSWPARRTRRTRRRTRRRRRPTRVGSTPPPGRTRYRSPRSPRTRAPRARYSSRTPRSRG